MKIPCPKKTILTISILFGLLLYHITDSSALEITDPQIKGMAQIHIEANFQTVGFVEVEHERLTIPKMDATFWKNKAFVKNAKISIHGMEGEPVAVSCAVLGQKILNRDCNGSPLKVRELLSGDSIKTGVAITADMINNNGRSDKIIFMKVSYM